MSRLLIWARIGYLTVCAITLVVGLTSYLETDARIASERRFSAYLATMLLGFPTAFFGAGALSDIAAHAGIPLFDIAADPPRFARDWLIAALLGYVQWIVFVPFAWRLFLRVFFRTQPREKET